jgi:hypothetical protein
VSPISPRKHIHLTLLTHFFNITTLFYTLTLNFTDYITINNKRLIVGFHSYRFGRLPPLLSLPIYFFLPKPPPNIHWHFLLNPFHMEKVLIIIVIDIVPVFVIVLICLRLQVFDVHSSLFGVILLIWYLNWFDLNFAEMKYVMCVNEESEKERLLSFGVEANLRDLLSRVTHLTTKAHSFYITHSLS